MTTMIPSEQVLRLIRAGRPVHLLIDPRFGRSADIAGLCKLAREARIAHENGKCLLRFKDPLNDLLECHMSVFVADTPFRASFGEQAISI